MGIDLLAARQKTKLPNKMSLMKSFAKFFSR